MNKTEKSQLIDQLKADLEGVPAVVATSVAGIRVNDVNELRRRLRKAGAELHVVKNTLARIAMADGPMKNFGEGLKGPSALAWHPSDPTAAAKVVVGFKKEKDKFTLTGAWFAGQLFDSAGVEALSKMPGKNELRSSFLSLLNGVPTKFVRTLAAAPVSMLNVLEARMAELEKSA